MAESSTRNRKKTKNIAIYHPDLDFFGGGETVALTIAHALKDEKVTIYANKKVNKKTLEKFFNLPITANIEQLPQPKGPNSLKKMRQLRSMYKELEDYDIVIDTCTNGWFDKKLNTKTICYVHYPNFPSKKRGIKAILNPFLPQPQNSYRYSKVFCNSRFTKQSIENYTHSDVLYPPVVLTTGAKNKKKRIVSIGRFTPEKKHEVMIEAFGKLKQKNYEMHIIGAYQKDAELYDPLYFEALQKLARKHNVQLHTNMPHGKVIDFLKASEIYWHARGYQETNPAEYENFGITTVEAMAAGCYCVVINLGAQPEIIKHKKTGYCWNSTEELLKYTQKIIKDKPKSILTAAKKAAKIYQRSEFIKKIQDACKKI